ncbi:MAG: hypothetical protein DMF72_20330, partial [Acidobacteria bacterium]
QNGRTVNYIYDSLYRLTNETISGATPTENGSVAYSYDAVGNRLSRTSSLAAVASTTSTYDGNDRLTGETYDNNGNALTANGNAYSYDFENHLTSLNGGAVTYVYDGDGRRVAKTVNGVTTRYLVDTNNPSGYAQVVDEIAGNQVVRSYTYGHALISQRQVIASQWEVSFYSYDGQGSVRLLTDLTGAITDRYTYDAFGNLIAATGNTPNEHLFAGEQYDTNAGFYYLRTRYLNPSTGRFLSLDSARGSNADPRSLHKYLYCLDDPINRIDPSGQSSIAESSVALAVGGILASGAMLGFFTYKALHNLPSNAFATGPDAGLIGYEVSFNVGHYLSRYPALGVATTLLNILGGVDVLVPFSSPRLWIYGYGGLGIGLEVDDIVAGKSASIHLGLVWNAKTPDAYSGPFFCTSFGASSINAGRWGFPLANLSLCSSTDQKTGRSGAYSLQAKVVQTGSNSPFVSASGTLYGQATEVIADDLPAIAPSYESLLNAARQMQPY